jgi:SAM-dependent methyltransferase
MKLDPVTTYFNSVGIGRPKSEGLFMQKGRKRFGTAFDDMMSVIAARANGIKLDPYDLKNSSLDLSLYVGEFYSSSMWRAFAEWLIRENFDHPAQVLDLGCENGVLTCFIASIWPDSTVIGVDRSTPAIAAAQALADKLGLKNVSFEHSDAIDFMKANPNRFSMVTATLAMHELLQGTESRNPFEWSDPHERLEDIQLGQLDEHAVEVLRAVETTLVNNGHFLSLDRSPTSATTWWYTQCLEQAGLKVSLMRSYTIECTSPSADRKFPLTVARKARKDETKTTLEELLSLASCHEVSAMSLTLKENMADVFIRSLAQTEIVFEAVAEYIDRSGIRTIRLLKTPTMLVLHDFTNRGFKSAFVAPLVGLPSVLDHCRKMISELEENCTVTAGVTDAGRALLGRLE